MSLYVAGHSCRENMSFDRHTLLHSFPGDGREPTSNRKYYLVSSGDMVASQAQPHAISTASAAAGWQPNLSTIVNVKVLRQQSPTAECPSVGSSSNPEVSDVRYRTEAVPCMQLASRRQLSDMVGHGRYVQSTSMSPRYQSPVGQPVLTVPLQHSADIPASLCQQMMINRRAMEEDVLPRASNRPSVLQQLTEELQEQKWRTSNMHAYAGSPKPSVVKPVPVKVQPGSTPRFHPLMSGPSHMSSSAVEPSAAQIASRRTESYRTTQSSSAAADFFSVMRSPRSSQPNLQHTPQSPPSRNIESHSPHCMSINQSVNVSQSLQFGSLDRSPTGRWHPASDRSVEGSYFSPTRSASGLLTSDVHEGLDLTCTAVRRSPVRCCQSQNYSPRQHGVVSPQNRGSAPRLPAAHTQMRSQELLSARLSSPRHLSPDQHATVSSPANLAPPGYSPRLGLPTSRTPMQSRELHSARLASPRNVSPKQHAALSSPANVAPPGYSSQQGFLTPCSPKSYSVHPHSSVSDASSRSRMSLDLHHGLGLPVRSRSTQDSMSVESPMQHAVGSPSKLFSPTQVNCLPLI